MALQDILLAQLVDPFRIGLILMLAITAARTEATVGSVVPLALGVIFVAILIPTSFGADNPLPQIGVGLVANALLLAVVLCAKFLFARLTRSRG